MWAEMPASITMGRRGVGWAVQCAAAPTAEEDEEGVINVGWVLRAALERNQIESRQLWEVEEPLNAPEVQRC